MKWNGFRVMASLMIVGFAVLLLSASVRSAALAVTYAGELVRIDEETGEAIAIGPTGFRNLNGLTRDASGHLYAIMQEGTIIEINRETGAGTFVIALPLPSPVHIVRAIAASADGELYYAHGSLYEWSEDMLAKFDPVSRSVTNIDILRVPGRTSVAGVTGLTFAPDGRLIGWDQTYYGLIEIDVSNASVTQIGPRLGAPGANIETVAYAEDGSLHGIGGYALSGRDNYFDFDSRGVPTSHVSIGPLDIRGMVFQFTGDDEEPAPPDPSLVRLPERLPPQPELIHNLYLVDCGPCPQCLERPCDPRVNPDLDSFLIWDPPRGLARSFSRKVLGLKPEDGPITAAAPLYGIEKQPLFIAALPYANTGGKDAGMIILFRGDGRILKRIHGQVSGERLGQSIEVWRDETVIASRRRLLRLQGTKVSLEQPLDPELRADRAVRVAFTRDIEGDNRPEILLGTPQAAVGGMPRAGRIAVIGSSRGQTLDVQYGRVAGQQLGQSLQPIRDDKKTPE